MRPFDADNLIALSFGNLKIGSIFAGSFTSYLPTYRPLSKLAVYLQYQLGGGEHLQSFFWINLLIWLVCAIGLYILLEKITVSRCASFVGAVGLLLDPRAIFALVWIGERQNTVCLLTGMIALYIAYSSRKINYKNLIIINVLLLSSMLSKEFGLAFVIPVFLIVSTRTKNYRIAFSVILSIVIYFLARFSLGAGSNNASNFCETMGYFNHTADVCYSHMSQIAKLKQYLYNSGASLIETFLPFLFSRVGTLDNLNFTFGFFLKFVFSLFLFFLSIWALIARYKDTIIWLLLIILSALSNFMLFRERNLLIAVLGFYILLGIGLSLFIKKIKNKYLSIGFACAVLVLIMFFNGLNFKQELDNFVYASGKNDPCRAFEKYSSDIDKTTVQTVSSYYNLNLNCQNR